MARSWFKSPLHDVYCGLRGFTKAHYTRLGQRCTGMEFATEMIVKSGLFGGKVAEVPITFHPDARKAHGPHLRTFRDGWRTVRLFLMCSPRHLFLIPGVALLGSGVLAFCLGLLGVTVGGVNFNLDTLLFGSLAILCAYQAIFFAICAKTLAINKGLLPEDDRFRRFYSNFTLETSLIIAAVVLVFGLALLSIAVNQWRLSHFGNLQYVRIERLVIPGFTLTALGFQTVLSAFLLNLMDWEE